MNKYNVYIIHGYTSSPNSNWFPYLKRKLETIINVQVHVLEMPDSDSPILKEWLNYMKGHIKNINEHTIFIGHSLGCVSILNFLNQYHKKEKLKSLFLISGFIEKSPIPELSEFVKEKLDYSVFINNINNRIVISAKDDDIVPFEYSRLLAEKLKAKFILLNEGKHFIDRDNFIEFPVLFDLIKNDVA